MAQYKFSYKSGKTTIALITAALLLALPAGAQAAEDYDGFGSTPFANQNHPGFGDSAEGTTPVNALAGAGQMDQQDGNELAASDEAAAALSEIAPAAGNEGALTEEGEVQGWATKWPESLVEIENEFAPMKKENDTALTPPTF